MKYLDLFSGCGGMSLGFESVGFELILAIEKSPMAGETFYHNLIEPIEGKEDWDRYLSKAGKDKIDSGIYIGQTSEILDNQNLLSHLKNKAGDLDLIVGGPPCQGFSMAGKRDSCDIRNTLPFEFLQYVSELNPKFVVMENVTGIRNKFNKEDKNTPLDEIHEELSKKYNVQAIELNANQYGVPQNRRRIFLIGARKDVHIKDLKLISGIWKSEYFQDGKTLCPKPVENRAFVVEDALLGLENLTRTEYKSKLDDLFLGTIKNSSGTLLNHNIRKHSERVVSRFKLYQAMKCSEIPLKILNWATNINENELKIKKSIKHVEYPIHSGDGEIVARNQSELLKLISELSTKKLSQKPLDLNEPSPTVMSMPDDVIHPIKPRAVTVREQARFQSFPDDFEFKGKETTGGKMRKVEVPQYTQVGNAVPPLLAREIALMIKNLLCSSET